MLSLDAPILLVDDSLAMQRSVLNTLGGAGYTNIHLASNGKDALAIIQEAIAAGKMFKIIFLDWMMPEMDGLALLKICRNDLNLKDVIIIMMTAVSDQKSLILAMGSGASSFLTKPIADETILKKIEQVGNWLDARGRDE